MNNTLLEVTGLNAYILSRDAEHHPQTLVDINFNLNRGQTLGIIGESGSGKTITLLSLLGLLDAQPGICTGSIRYNVGSVGSIDSVENTIIDVLADIGEVISLTHDHDKRLAVNKNIDLWKQKIEPAFQSVRGKIISMVFQNPRLAFNPYMSIGKQINETIRLNTAINDKKIAKEKTIEWLAAVKMDAPHIRYNNNPYGLSGGMCQRAMLAMALASESPIIVADEPTSGLDATLQADILELLANLKADYKKSMIIVSHDLSVVRRIADQVLVYYQGNIVESGTIDEVLNQTRPHNHPYTHSMISANRSTDFSDNSDSKQNVPMNKGCVYYSACKDKHQFGNLCAVEKPSTFKLNDNHQVACWKYQ